MHPAKSVILFSVLSGLGYGTINTLLLSLLGGHPPSNTHSIGMLIGLVLSTIGLLSSTFHLGRPERVWRALSQWRTSWLSREGVCAFLSFICPLAIIALAYFGTLTPSTTTLLAIVGIVINLLTVHCTAMIYASLKPIPAWHNHLTPVVYQLLSLTTGSSLVLAMLVAVGKTAPFMLYLTLFMLIVSWLVKRWYWYRVANAAPIATATSATGIKGNVSLFEKPHSSANYLMKEMIFQVGRNHAHKLRQLVFVLGFMLPAIVTIVALYLPVLGWLVVVGFLSTMMGIFIERWLFFAEAKHVVSLYYGQNRV